MPRIPARSMSPSTVARTKRSWMPRRVATVATPAVRHPARPARTISTGVTPRSVAAKISGWSVSRVKAWRCDCSAPTPLKCSMEVRVWTPSTQVDVARHWKSASSGMLVIASRAPRSASTLTPLSTVGESAVVVTDFSKVKPRDREGVSAVIDRTTSRGLLGERPEIASIPKACPTSTQSPRGLRDSRVVVRHADRARAARDADPRGTTMELTARTKPGSELVELAEELAGSFADTVGQHDRSGEYIRDHLTTLVDNGWLSAPVPAEFGGRGVRSTHDLFVAASRLARGDAASTIGVSMHVVVVTNMVRQYLAADGGEQAALGGVLDLLVSGRVVMAAAISEPGQDLTRPSTVAVPEGGRWTVNGSKIFCTMSPAADIFLASVTVAGPKGERYAYVAIPSSAPGVVVHDDWDALGMRTSGSNSVTFTDVTIDASA